MHGMHVDSNTEKDDKEADTQKHLQVFIPPNSQLGQIKMDNMDDGLLSIKIPSKVTSKHVSLVVNGI